MGHSVTPDILRKVSGHPLVHCRVFHPHELSLGVDPPDLHVKAFMFDRDDGHGALLIGSSNLTLGGLGRNLEWNYFSTYEVNIPFSEHGSPFTWATGEFDDMWENRCRVIDEEFLSAYEDRRRIAEEWVRLDPQDPAVIIPQHVPLMSMQSL